MLERIEFVNIQKETQKRIKDYIRGEGLGAGDPIPTEKELAERIGVSRSAIRESLKGLEFLGLIEARHGVGRFVREFDFDVLLESIEIHITSDSQAFRDLFEIRRCLESNFIVREADAFTAEDIQELESIISAMGMQIANTEHGNTLDRELIDSHTRFHSSLFRRSGNKLLFELIKIFSTLHYKLISSNPDYREDRLEFLFSHRQIIDAIKTNDPGTMSRAVYEHFTEPAAWSTET